MSNSMKVYSDPTLLSYYHRGGDTPLLGHTIPQYFQNIVIYIHRNPEMHGIVNDFREWPFSSYETILSDKPTELAKTAVLKWFDTLANYKHSHQPPDLNSFHHLLDE